MTCLCCCDESVEPRDHEPLVRDLEALYEETDWVNIKAQPLIAQQVETLAVGLSGIRRASAQLALSALESRPNEVKRELSWWLGRQASLLDRDVGLIEVFTDKAPLSQEFERRTGLKAIRIGLAHGQDLNNLADRRRLLWLIGHTRPGHVWFSFPCHAWGPLSRSHIAKGGSAEQTVRSARAKARRHLRAVSECWNLQVTLGGHCHAENPLSSDAWKELALRHVHDASIHQCVLGLTCPRSGRPVLKPTRIRSTNADC